jgi:hypothetical protein
MVPGAKNDACVDNALLHIRAEHVRIMSAAARPDRTVREPPRLSVSTDGYVRLTLTAFHAVRLLHLFSELDPDAAAFAVSPAGASAATLVGFTEWASETLPALSLGWNWRLAVGNAPARYERDGEVRSNIMFIDANGRDYGTVGTDALLREAIAALDWQCAVSNYISNRYA